MFVIFLSNQSAAVGVCVCVLLDGIYTHTMGTGSSPGIKRPGRRADHPPHLSAEVKKE